MIPVNFRWIKPSIFLSFNALNESYSYGEKKFTILNLNKCFSKQNKTRTDYFINKFTRTLDTRFKNNSSSTVWNTI